MLTVDWDTTRPFGSLNIKVSLLSASNIYLLATVHLVCRSKEKGESAVEEIKKESNNSEVYLHLCDLAEPKEIKTAMTEYQQQYGKLDILVKIIIISFKFILFFRLIMQELCYILVK